MRGKEFIIPEKCIVAAAAAAAPLKQLLCANTKQFVHLLVDLSGCLCKMESKESSKGMVQMNKMKVLKKEEGKGKKLSPVFFFLFLGIQKGEWSRLIFAHTAGIHTTKVVHVIVTLKLSQGSSRVGAIPLIARRGS